MYNHHKDTVLPASRADRLGASDHWASWARRALPFLHARGIGEVIRLVRQHGPNASFGFMMRKVRHSVASMALRVFDRHFGVDTSGAIQLRALAIDNQNTVHGAEAVSHEIRLDQ